MSRAIAMFATALAVAVLGPASSADSAATAKPRAHLIAFVGTATGAPELYTVRPDGTGVRQLTDDGVYGLPQWSPDGRRVLVHRECPNCAPTEFAIMRPDGSDRVDIAGTRPLFSPNGNWLSYLVCGGTCDLYVAHASGRHSIRVDTGVSDPDGRPAAWSSDSRQLVYVKRGVGRPLDYSLWIADRRGRERVHIPTDTPGSSTDAVSSPVFFPNDDTITFLRSFFSPSIFSISIGDTVPTLRGNLGQDFGLLLESPIGNRLALVGATQGTGGAIRVLNGAADTDGFFVTEFSASGPSSDEPVWSPEGSSIAYRFCERTGPSLGGPCALKIVGPSGGSTVYNGPAVEVGDWVRGYDWSPDSSELVLSVSNAGGPFRLHTVNADGSGLAPLLSGSDNQYMPAWQP